MSHIVVASPCDFVPGNFIQVADDIFQVDEVHDLRNGFVVLSCHEISRLSRVKMWARKILERSFAKCSPKCTN